MVISPEVEVISPLIKTPTPLEEVLPSSPAIPVRPMVRALVLIVTPELMVMPLKVSPEAASDSLAPKSSPAPLVAEVLVILAAIVMLLGEEIVSCVAADQEIAPVIDTAPVAEPSPVPVEVSMVTLDRPSWVFKAVLLSVAELAPAVQATVAPMVALEVAEVLIVTSIGGSIKKCPASPCGAKVLARPVTAKV